MRQAFLVVFIFILGACTPRGDLIVYPAAQGVGAEQTVFVATTRLKAERPTRYSRARSFNPSFARYRVSIPPEHKAGELEWAERGRLDPRKHFVSVEEVIYEEPQTFRAGLAQAIRQAPRGQREVVLFVHGFNNTFAEGVYRLAQMKHDYNIPGVAVHYSWPSAANPLGYAYDRDSVLFARDELERLMQTIVAAGAQDISIISHSMGGLLTMEALRQLSIAGDTRVKSRISGVLMVSPDIDKNIFRSQVRRIGELPQPFVIFTSKRDRALALSARLTGQRERLGNVRDIEEVADLDVTLVDVTSFGGGDDLGHFAPATSPALIALLRNLPQFDEALGRDRSSRPGILPGTVLTLRNATQIILNTGSKSPETQRRLAR